MAKFVMGTAGYIGWIFAGGTTALLPNYTTIEFNQSGDNADTTSGSATWDTHIPTRQNWDMSLEMFFDDGSSNGTADFSKLIANSTGVMFFGPLGTATGKPKYGGSATVTKADMPLPFADPVTVKLSLKGNGQPYWNQGSAF
jgi:hypothetical protein